MRRFERTWEEGRKYLYAGMEITRWSTPYVLVEFAYGFYTEAKIGPFYIGGGWWGKR